MSGKFRPAVLAVVVALAGSAGCSLASTAGSGPVTTQTRQVGEFERIEVGNGIRVTVNVGPAQPLQLEAHENLHSIITANVDGGVLRILSTSSFMAVPAPSVTVGVPSLTGVSASGGSQVTADGVAADMFGIELSGGSALTVSGSASTVALDGGGGSRVNGFGLTAGTVVLDLSGGSTAEVQASEEVSGSVSGGARATVAGGATITASTSGGGSVASQ